MSGATLSIRPRIWSVTTAPGIPAPGAVWRVLSGAGGTGQNPTRVGTPRPDTYVPHEMVATRKDSILRDCRSTRMGSRRSGGYGRTAVRTAEAPRDGQAPRLPSALGAARPVRGTTSSPQRGGDDK